jgi:ribosomal-protein-alanine N-acetyltransferase
MAHFTDQAESVIQNAKRQAMKRGGKEVIDVDILCALVQSCGGNLLPQLNSCSILCNANLKDEPIQDLNIPWTSQAILVLDKARQNAWPLGRCAGVEDLLHGLLAVKGEASRMIQGTTASSKTKPGMEKREIRVHIRWMIRRDMPEVIAIETESFEFPWEEEDFYRCLRQRCCIGIVAEHDDRVAGFMVYELCKTRIHVLDFAVARKLHRHSVGTQMLDKLKRKLYAQRRTRITLKIRETNLPGQQFFRSNQFRAVSVLRGFFEDVPEDAYLMQHKFIRQTAEPLSVNHIANLGE